MKVSIDVSGAAFDCPRRHESDCLRRLDRCLFGVCETRLRHALNFILQLAFASAFATTALPTRP